MRNILSALSDRPSLRHVALVTGLKHYLGPFEAYGKGYLPETPLREEQGRLPSPNFYTDMDLGLEVECMADTVKSRKPGFLGYQDSRDSFFTCSIVSDGSESSLEQARRRIQFDDFPIYHRA